MNLSLDELKCWLALKAINGLGNIGATKLLQHFDDPRTLFSASAAQLQALKLKPAIIQQITHFDFETLKDALAWRDEPDRHILPLNSPYYPSLLKQIHSPPIVLFALGNREILFSPQLAVVGSRNPTPNGIANTQSFCRSLCEQGITITSGLALGIDGEAHRAALAADGYTIAVTGTGLNRVYPSCHRELAHLIAKRGLLVSEKFPNELYDRGSFPQRNRIIAGLSLGTLVIEAASKSGSLITANHSMEEGREVYAVPGSIHNPLARGCHALIKQGAKLVECIEDIIEDLPCVTRGQIDLSIEPTRTPLNSELASFLQLIDYEITSIDTIITRSQLTVDVVTNTLLMLELEGWIINSTGGYIRQ